MVCYVGYASVFAGWFPPYVDDTQPRPERRNAAKQNFVDISPMVGITSLHICYN